MTTPARLLPLLGAGLYLMAGVLAGALSYGATRLVRPELAADFLDRLLTLPLGPMALGLTVLGGLLGLFHARFTLGASDDTRWLAVAAPRAFLALPLAMLFFPLVLVAGWLFPAPKKAHGELAMAPALLPFLPLLRLDRARDPALPRAFSRRLLAWLPVALLLFVAATQIATSAGDASLDQYFATRRDAYLERVADAPTSPMSPLVALVWGTLAFGEYLLSTAAIASIGKGSRS